MNSEISGYIEQVQPAENPTKRPTAKQSIWQMEISLHILRRMSAVILMELGAISISIAEGDCTAFLMLLFIAITMILRR